MQDLYSRLGASSSKEEVHAAIKNLDKGIAPGAFCKVMPDIFGGDSNFVNLVHADGAGTKSILAYLYWRETGNLDVWKWIAQDALVMNIDDLLCVGATGNFLVTSTIGRNRRLVPGEIIQAVIEGTEEFCEMLRNQGIPIVFGGGETADVGDLVKTVMVDSNVSCRLKRSAVIEAAAIRPGQVVVGLTSYGQSTYETSYNSGIASNGLTLARHVLLSDLYAEKYPESIDSHLVGNGGYTGKYKLTDRVFRHHSNLGLGLLSPTRTFAPIIRQVLQNVAPGSVTGLIHNTGGGHAKAKKFIGNMTVEKELCWQIPEIFELIQAESGISWAEMLGTFNCGLRMEIYCNQAVAETIIAISRSFGVEAMQIGMVNAGEAPAVTLRSGGQLWRY